MSEIILGGLWFGTSQPPMDLFLQPFVDHIPALSKGFVLRVADEVWNMRAFLIGCCVDSGARGKVQGVQTHGGTCPCNWCTIAGSYIDGAMRYFYEGEAPPLRTHTEMLHQQCTLSLRENSSHDSRDDSQGGDSDQEQTSGVKAVSPLARAPGFGLVRGFFVEYMHAGNLGINQSMLKRWLDYMDVQSEALFA